MSKPKVGETLLEKMFAEIMPNVTFVDATPAKDNGVVRKSGKKISTRQKVD